MLKREDVIVFQELFSKQCLEDIFQTANLQNHYQLVSIKDDDKSTSEHDVVFAKFRFDPAEEKGDRSQEVGFNQHNFWRWFYEYLSGNLGC